MLKHVTKRNLKHIGIPVPQNKKRRRQENWKKKEEDNDLGDGKSTRKEQSKRSRRAHERRRKMDIEKLSSIDTCALIELRGKMS
jgi:hypothetical protein